LTFTCLTQADAQQTPNSYPVQVEYTAFRPAKWEESALTEETNEKRNKGGLVFIYYTNTSDQPVSLREWYINERESGHYRLAGDVAWDRRYAQTLEPGQTTVQEICGVSDDFQTAKPATGSSEATGAMSPGQTCTLNKKNCASPPSLWMHH